MGSYIMLCIPPLSRLARCACSYYLSYLFFCIILLIELNFKNGCKDTEKSRQYKILRPFFVVFALKVCVKGKLLPFQGDRFEPVVTQGGALG